MSENRLSVFESTMEKSYAWVNEVRNRLGIVSQDEAYRSLRSGLHAIRDQLDVVEAVQLAAQLPMLLRGMYFEGWSPNGRRHVRSAEEFESLIARYHGSRPQKHPREIAAVVMSVLRTHAGDGTCDQALDRFSEPVRSLFSRTAAS